MAEWWNKNNNIPWNDSNFLKIVDFYLFNCPCETEKGSKKNGTKEYIKVSKRATTLRSQGWTGGYLNTLLASMKHTACGRLEYHTFNTSADISAEVRRIEKDGSIADRNFEMVAMSERSDMNKTSSIYYYIRNALAHGSFSLITDKGNCIYYFESARDGDIKAQIRLREETLLQWINDFALSPKMLKQTLKQDRTRRKSRKKGGAAA